MNISYIDTFTFDMSQPLGTYTNVWSYDPVAKGTGDLIITSVITRNPNGVALDQTDMYGYFTNLGFSMTNGTATQYLAFGVVGSAGLTLGNNYLNGYFSPQSFPGAIQFDAHISTVPGGGVLSFDVFGYTL